MRKRETNLLFSIIVSFVTFLHNSARADEDHPSKNSKSSVSRTERGGEWELARKVSSEVRGVEDAPGYSRRNSAAVVNDVSRINPVYVSDVIRVQGLSDLQKATRIAQERGLKVSIAGKRHSQGGQQSCSNCIVLDMLEFNKILSFDAEHNIIRVQPGVTWEQIQNYAKP